MRRLSFALVTLLGLGALAADMSPHYDAHTSSTSLHVSPHYDAAPSAGAATPEPPDGFLIRYDYANVDGSNNSTLSDMDSVAKWVSTGSLDGADAEQSTSSAMPTYRANGGDPYISWDGGDHLVTGDNAFTTINQPYTTIVVAGRSATGSNIRLVDGPGASERGFIGVLSTDRVDMSAGTQFNPGTTVGSGSYDFLMGYFNGTSSKLYVNGVVETGSAGTHTIDGFSVGGTYLIGSFVGQMKEVLVYPGDMTGDASLISYLEDRYGSPPVSF